MNSGWLVGCSGVSRTSYSQTARLVWWERGDLSPIWKTPLSEICYSQTTVPWISAHSNEIHWKQLFLCSMQHLPSHHQYHKGSGHAAVCPWQTLPRAPHHSEGPGSDLFFTWMFPLCQTLGKLETISFIDIYVRIALNLYFSVRSEWRIQQNQQCYCWVWSKENNQNSLFYRNLLFPYFRLHLVHMNKLQYSISH